MMGRRDSGTCGRHRAGQVRPAVVHRRLWDGPARAEAERLAQAWPNWSVLYGVGSRRFYAIATWQVSERLMVEAATGEELERRMYEAVMTVTARREAPLTTPTPPAPPTLLASSSPLSRRGGSPSPAPAAAPHHSRRPYQGAA